MSSSVRSVVAGVACAAAVILGASAHPRAQVAVPAPAPAGAASNPAAPLPLDPAIRAGRLPNGLRYFLRQNGRPAKRVSLRLAVDVGSIHEADDQRGLAHFLEHMAFNGSTNFKPGELVAFLESIGARFGPHVNASTSFDETIYMLDVPTDRDGYVDKGLLALRDFADGATLSGEEIDKERGVVLEEWRGRLGAGSRITDQQLPVLFGRSRYAVRLPIGLPETLRTFPHQRLRDFYKTWYRADRMAVVVAGDLPLDEAERLVRARFGDLATPSAPAPVVDRAVPPHTEPQFKMVVDSEAQRWSVTAAYTRPPDPDGTLAAYERSVVQSLGVQMLNARLAEIAQRADAPFLGADAGAAPLGRGVALFELSAEVAPGRLAGGLAAVVGEARRAERFGFSPAEIDRAKRAVLAGYERAFNERGNAESPSLANELVRHVLQDEPAPGIAYEFEVVKQVLARVTPAQITSALGRLLEGSQVVLGVAPAGSAAPGPTDETLRTAMMAAVAAPVTPWVEAAAGRALVEKTPARGRVTNRRRIDELGVMVLTLSNGVEVWLKPTDFKADQVVFSAYAYGGSSLASEADHPESVLGPVLVSLGGVGGLNPVDLEKVLAGRIASATPDIDSYTHGVSGTATPKDLETALQLTYLTFTAPGIGEESFGLLRRRLAPMLENQRKNPRFVFGEAVRRTTTSNHYTSRSLTPADLDGLDLGVIRRGYADRFSNAADFTFFFVGAFTEADLTPMLEQWIASLPSTGPRRTTYRDLGVRFPSAITRETVTLGKEPAGQTVVSFFADTGLDEREMHRARAAANVVSIRLRDLLREQLGGTYGVSVNYGNTAPQKGYGTMNVSFGSDPGRADALQRAVVDEIARLQKDGPTADDLQKVQELERRDLETSTRQNQYWLGSLQTVHILGWDARTIARRAERTNALTVPLLHEAIRKYFPLDRYVVVTLTPE